MKISMYPRFSATCVALIALAATPGAAFGQATAPAPVAPSAAPRAPDVPADSSVEEADSAAPEPAADSTAVLGDPIQTEAVPGVEEMSDDSLASADHANDATSFQAAWRSGRMFGYSGQLRATVISLDEAGVVQDPSSVHLARWVPVFEGGGPRVLGEAVRIESVPTPSEPGIYMVEYGVDELATARAIPLAVIAAVPFEAKESGYLNGYHIGRYPVEGSGRTDRYAPPGGFIEITLENQDFQISEHFRLRQFLTKDQGDVWPKYLALDLRLIDKLELVLQELNAMGVRAEALHVMSGFRTPQYNGPGGDGRATLSRHTYGDAADVWVDNDGDGYMDDLNGDGRADLQDARIMMRAVERVERRYPELIGGAGVYVANSAHGPFIHIDVRGSHARW